MALEAEHVGATDEGVIARCLAGDRSAEAAVARRAATLSLRTAALAMGGADSANDVSQEVAVRVLRGLHRLHDPERFDAWVYRITVSEIRRAHNRVWRHRSLSLDESAADGLAAAGDEPAERVDALALRGELRVALADLSVRERTAIALRYVHDLADDQIAAAMRCRPGTVRSLISRAQARLRSHPALADTAGPRPPLPIAKETLT